MEIKDIYVQPGHLIRRAQQGAHAAFMAEARSLGITPVQYSALIVIKDFPGIDATRLSELIYFDRTTIGQVIERLEAKGLVSRKTGIEDKRTKRIFVTLRGKEAIQKVTAVLPRVNERILGELSPAERATFMRLLARMVGAEPDDETVTQSVRERIARTA